MTVTEAGEVIELRVLEDGRVDLADPRLWSHLREPPPPLPPRVWTCDSCGRQDVWGPGWAWFTDGVRPRKWADPEVQFVVCSDACRRKSPYASARRDRE